MMRRLPALFRTLTTVVLLCAAILPGHASAQPMAPADPNDGRHFRAIALHDVRAGVRESFEAWPEPTALDERTVADFFAWLKASDHHPVSLQQVVDACAGGAPLPPRAVLLTVDDGYVSTYTALFPLLKQYRYPIVVALVTSWLEVPAGEIVSGYLGRTPLTREQFLTWEQAREMADSGLVEFASHTHGLHRGLTGNPQGNQQPAATTHVYDPDTRRYETDEAYVARVQEDLRQSRALIERNTGKPVRAVVWPYGAYNQPAQEAARRVGMPIMMTLEEGTNGPDVPLDRIRRALATYDMPVPDLSLWRTPAGPGPYSPPNRAMHIDLDYVYDPDPVQQEANLSRLLDRVLDVGPRSVFLQAFADPDGDGVADSMYFPNRHLPVRADLFNRVAWQLRTRTGVQVYAWMPVMAFELPADHPLAGRQVKWTPTDAPTQRYARLTPFDADVRTLIGEIYEDLGRYTTIAGVLFHDDALFGDDEDISDAALNTYAEWGLPRDIAAIRADPELSARWTHGKTRFLNEFTLAMADKVRTWQPRLLTARNLYALTVMQPESESWFAQSYTESLKTYDYTAIMAMPYMENVDKPAEWLADMTRRVAATPGGLEGTIFELQARDWRTGEPVPDATLREHFSLIKQLGGRHFAYYPDDFYNDQPGLDTARRAVSVRATLQESVDELETPPALAPPKPGPDVMNEPAGLGPDAPAVPTPPAAERAQ